MNNKDRTYTNKVINEVIVELMRLRYLTQVVMANTDELSQAQWIAIEKAIDEIASVILSEE